MHRTRDSHMARAYGYGHDASLLSRAGQPGPRSRAFGWLLRFADQ